LQGKIKWISNGVNTDNFDVPHQATDNEKFTITYTGAIGKANVLDTLFEAAQIQQRPNSPGLVMIGNRPQRGQLPTASHSVKSKLDSFVDGDTSVGKAVYCLSHQRAHQISYFWGGLAPLGVGQFVRRYGFTIDTRRCQVAGAARGLEVSDGRFRQSSLNTLINGLQAVP